MERYYSTAHYLGLLREVRDLLPDIDMRKNEMGLADLQDSIDHLSVLYAQLTDAMGYMAGDLAAAESRHRKKFLKTVREVEQELRATNDPATGKRWTDIDSRKRHLAEERCEAEADEVLAAKQEYEQLNLFLRKGIPQVLIGLGRRAELLKADYKERLKDYGSATSELAPGQQVTAGQVLRGAPADDGFNAHLVRLTGKQELDELMDELDDGPEYPDIEEDAPF